jgi:hypothetical protein
MIQPVARLYGRIKFGLTPWRKRGAGWSWKYLGILKGKTFLHWSEKWHSNEDYLIALEENLISQQMRALRGGDFDRWDLQTGNRLFAYVRCLLTVEEHGAGTQYVKIKSTVSLAGFSLIALTIMGILACLSFFYQEWFVGGVFSSFALSILLKCMVEKSNVLHSLQVAIAHLPKQEAGQMVVIHKAEDTEVISKTNKKSKLLKLNVKEKREMTTENPKSLSQVHGI